MNNQQYLACFICIVWKSWTGKLTTLPEDTDHMISEVGMPQFTKVRSLWLCLKSYSSYSEVGASGI